MKRLLIFLLLVTAIAAHSQDTLDISKAGSWRPGSGLTNVICDGSGGATAQLQAIINYNNATRHDSLLVLKAPAWNLLKTDSTVYMQDNIKLLKLNFFSTAAMATGADVIQSIAHSNWGLERCTYTNNFSKYINAFVEVKASPKKCENINLLYNTVISSWGYAMFELASAATNDSTYWLNNVNIIGDTIKWCFNPSKPYMTSGSDYNTNAEVDGIHLMSAFRNTIVRDCYIDHCGGRGIASYGLNQSLSHDKYNGSVEIDHNTISRCWFLIELNGNYYPNQVWIHNNKLNYAAGSFITSVEGKGLKEEFNEINTIHHCFEFSASDGSLKGNNVKFCYWRDSTMGPQPTAGSRWYTANIYGSGNVIEGNTVAVDSLNPAGMPVNTFSGFSIVAKASNGDTAYDRNNYMGITDYASYLTFRNNYLSGITERALDGTNAPARYVEWSNNTVISNNPTGDFIIMLGKDWFGDNNKFFLTGAPAPNGKKIFSVGSKQAMLGLGVIRDRFTNTKVYGTVGYMPYLGQGDVYETSF